MLLLLSLFLQATASGAVGLSLGMMLETTLFMVRMNMPESLDVRYAHLLDKKYDKKQPTALGEQSAGHANRGPRRKGQLRGAVGANVRDKKKII